MPTVQLFLDSSEALSGGTLQADAHSQVQRLKSSLISLVNRGRQVTVHFTAAHTTVLLLLTNIFSVNHSSTKTIWERKSGSRSASKCHNCLS